MADPNLTYVDALRAAHFQISDAVRRTQATALEAFGLGVDECAFGVISTGPYWRLRAYGGREEGPALLIIAAPIKRPYIWDITPSVSAVRYCLQQGTRVYLLEWTPPVGDNGRVGLDEYVGQAIAACVTKVTDTKRAGRPFLMGHSLGGTLAAIFCALEPLSAQGLVLLGSPLYFGQGSSRFRDALVTIVPSTLPEDGAVAGSLLSQVSVAASPDEFLWSRWIDAAFSFGDPSAMDMHARVEHWALDEVALPGKLVNQILGWLYRENRFCGGTLSICGKSVGPSDLQIPTLAIVNTSDEVGPLASVAPFIERMSTDDTEIIKFQGGVGVGFQHLAILTGRHAYSEVWPEIMLWLRRTLSRSGVGASFGRCLRRKASR